jgi:hypothetical protein
LHFGKKALYEFARALFIFRKCLHFSIGLERALLVLNEHTNLFYSQFFSCEKSLPHRLLAVPAHPCSVGRERHAFDAERPMWLPFEYDHSERM